MSVIRPLLALVLATLIAAPPAVAKPPKAKVAEEPGREYHDCLAAARANPEAGYERAQAWAGLGGGEAARHCAAVALIGLGKHEQAARSLEDLAQQSRRAPAVRAGMLAQAGQAWLLAHNPERANAAQTAAIGLVKDNPDLYIDRAATLAEAKNYREAVDDLDTALTLDPNRADALVFRASALRYTEAFDLARRDVDRALRLVPNHVEALLERGILERLAGRPAKARADWLRIVRTDPNSPAADAARRNLEILDIDPAK